MRVGIVGSRDWPESKLDLVRKVIDGLGEDVIVVSGGARGVDKKAEEAARARGLTVLIFNARWQTPEGYDPTAGFKRNAELVESVDRVIAFVTQCSKCKDKKACPGVGWSHSTADTIRRAKDAGKIHAVAFYSEGSVAIARFDRKAP